MALLGFFKTGLCHFKMEIIQELVKEKLLKICEINGILDHLKVERIPGNGKEASVAGSWTVKKRLA